MGDADSWMMQLATVETSKVHVQATTVANLLQQENKLHNKRITSRRTLYEQRDGKGEEGQKGIVSKIHKISRFRRRPEGPGK
jgi:hypothetical protein